MQTSSPAATGADPFSAVEAVTTAHLTLIAVFAVLVVIAMIYGARLKHKRKLARQEEQERLDAYEDEHRDTPPAAAVPPVGPSAPSAEPAAPPSRQDDCPRPAPASSAPVLAQSQSQTQSSPVADVDSSAGGPVTQLKGLGPKVAARLAELGITCVGQIAALDDDGADAIDSKLGPFQGRLARDRWVEQARFLAAGDRAGFEAVFGRL